jgi:hypothetical protein
LPDFVGPAIALQTKIPLDFILQMNELDVISFTCISAPMGSTLAVTSERDGRLDDGTACDEHSEHD